ncbi:MAG: NlpC/P60 family protein [Firmicutes bacterium]|nr:NlpC/P60 family protein [Bacillota bacterium]
MSDNNENNNNTTNGLPRQPRKINPIDTLNDNDIKNEEMETPLNNVPDIEDDVEEEVDNNENVVMDSQLQNARQRNRVGASKLPTKDSMSQIINNKINNLRNNNKKKNDENQDDKNKKTTANNKAKEASSKMASAVGAANQVVKKAKEEGENAASAAAQVAKEKTKAVVRKKIFVFLVERVLPFLLPILGILLLILLVIAVVFIVTSSITDEKINVTNMYVNYCDNVKVKWEEWEGTVLVEKEETVTNKEYLAYQMAVKNYKEIDNEEVLRALAIIYRTNLYYNSNNMSSNTCEFEIDQPYFDPKEDDENQVIFDAIEYTHNKVFSLDPINLSELKIDDNFTYKEVTTTYDGEVYVLSQDDMYYIKDWIDSTVDSNYIKQGDADKDSFSPWAAWYLVEKMDQNYHGILYHFYDWKATGEGHIYNVVKFGGSGGEYGSYCSDISLTETTLSREEFINYVMSNVNNGAFKSNAGRIYDISVENNFNPEMVVVRAVREGFDPGGSSNNYWGLGCFNGASEKQCQQFPSFDAGVMGFINNIKNHNYATAYQMMMKYSYIGRVWLNPGGSGVGGCYYFPYIREYLSEERQSVVEAACAEGNKCTGSEASCVPTTDEDQSAYAKWQVSRMSETRQQVFDLGGESCTEEGDAVATGDLLTLGKRVAEYAVATYDSWSYSQSNRHQDGYVDCSSMVSRAYGHFSYKIYDSSDTSGEIYRWCEKNGKVISSGSLSVGDLIFYAGNGYANSDNYKSIGHVSMYIGNNQEFAAHGQWQDKNHTVPKPQPDQVSVSLYKGNGTYFCRPAK